MKKTLCLLLAALLVLSLAACGKPSSRPKNIRISYGKMPAAGPAGMKTTL